MIRRTVAYLTAWLSIAWLGAATIGFGNPEPSPASAERASAIMTGGRFTYMAKAGDSLWLVGARFGIEVAPLAALNGLSRESRLRVGQPLLVDNRHLIPESLPASLVINIPQRLLFHAPAGDPVTAFPVGLGRPSWPTFVGAFTIASLETNPVWDVPASIQEEMRRAGQRVVTRVAPGPDNPLGRYWIGLDRPGYGIHGTNAPASVYHFQTHGCIRLHPDDVESLFHAVSVGAHGAIVYEPILLARDGDGAIWLEAHADIYRRSTDGLATVRAIASHEELEGEMNWQAVGAVLRARLGTPVDVTLRTPR